MSLLDFARDHVVVALRALHLQAEDHGCQRLSHGLRIVLSLVKIPNSPAILGPSRPRNDEVMHDFVPRTIVAEGVFQKGEPLLVSALVLPIRTAPRHQNGIKNL